MKCPHCLTDFHDERKINYLIEDVNEQWAIESYLCPKCKRSIFFLINGKLNRSNHGGGWSIAKSPQTGDDLIVERNLVRPRGSSRPPVPEEVPSQIASDYTEACIVLPDSLKASAALSRRCLQNLLRLSAGIKHDDLAREIQQVIDSNKLPTHIAESIDAIRSVGNYAAHPLKSKSTGEIIEVDPGEAEWNLEVLEMLFDFYYVQPERTKQRRAALNSKLNDAGKPNMKAKAIP